MLTFSKFFSTKDEIPSFAVACDFRQGFSYLRREAGEFKYVFKHISDFESWPITNFAGSDTAEHLRDRSSHRSSRFLSFSWRRSNKRAKKRAREGARLG